MISCLVIDDNSFDRKILRHAAERCSLDLKLSEVADISSAKEVLSTKKFDCVLLDFRLPDGDGLTFAERFLATEDSSPVIMLTGQGNEQIAREAFQLGIHDYLSKDNLTSKTLDHVIVNALARRKFQQIQNDLLNEAMGDALRCFASQIVFNLKSPIGDVKKLCNSLSEKYCNVLDEEGQRSLTRVVSAADRASNLIDGLLAHLLPAELDER